MAILPLLLAACGPDAQQQADYAAVERSGASPAIYDKMVHGDPLSLSDIVSLTHARVNDGVILRYIRDQGTVYYLHRDDFKLSARQWRFAERGRLHGLHLEPNYWGPGAYPYYGPYGGPGPYYGPGPGITVPDPFVPIGIGIGIGGGGGHWR